jgi:hypothetical protein
MKGLKGSKHHNWKGGIKVDINGYIRHWMPSHPRADHQGCVLESVLVVEKAFGRGISQSERIHHIDGDKKNNSIYNLMVFANHAMHSGFHRRLTAYNKCGHYDWRQCSYCHSYDDTKNMTRHGRGYYHNVCYNQYRRNKRIIGKDPDPRVEITIEEMP